MAKDHRDRLAELEDIPCRYANEAVRPVGPSPFRIPTGFPVPEVWGD